MSKLGDAIRRSQRVEAAPMGFGAARQTPKATMLVGYLATSTAGVEGARGAGADVILLRSDGALPETGDIPLGVWGVPPDSGEAQKGIDFLVVEPETTAAAVLLNEDRGYVLLLPANPEELFLRSLEPLTLDALYLSEAPAPLTVADQIALLRTSNLARKPLACRVSLEVSKDDLQCLRAAGVVLLVIEGEPGGVKQLKETVLALPPRRQRRDERPVVSLPRGRAPVENDDDDDDP